MTKCLPEGVGPAAYLHTTLVALVWSVIFSWVSVQPTRADDDAWAFHPLQDTFDSSALLDLRSLNEKNAGENGYVRLSPDGNDFVLGNGRPARFWAVTDYIGDKPDDVQRHHARWLAKRGVNMVRVHTALQPTEAGAPITAVNQTEIDHIFHLVAAMRSAGIYVTISPYWSVPVKIQDSWAIPGGMQSAAGLLFWDPTMQKGYKAWIKALLTPTNPYTHIPLAKDPALAIFQIQNEDSMLFWTIQGIKGSQLEALQTLFGEFLKKKYGSLEKALAAWNNDHANGDAPDQGRVGILIAWEWTQQRSGGRAKRLADQLEFFGETMRQFNRMIADYIHNVLGCQALINAGNWKTVDDTLVNDVERYSYTSTDVMAVNRYYGGVHQGSRAGWGIMPGDHFTNASALLDPRGFPLNLKQVAGHPFIISESQWVPPDAWQAEGPFLVAAYSSLTGVDAFYWFAQGDPEWQMPFPQVRNWGPPMGKWQIGTPEQLGQFPAAAFMFRQQYIQQGTPVVHEERPLDDLWNRRVPVVSEASGFDPNRDAGDALKRSNLKTAIDPLAFLVGPVQVKYGGAAAHTTAIDFTKYIDHSAKTIRSVTGQLAMNYGIGLCTLNAPKAQGACGFLAKAGPQELADVSIDCRNQYASILLVALDGQPLAVSHQVLLQVGTVARPHGWIEKDASFVSDKRTIQG